MSDIVKLTRLTELGQAYLAKQQAGLVPMPEITRAVAGEGFVPWEELEAQQTVSDPVAEMQMDEPTVLDKKYVKIPLRIMNTDLDDSIHIRQIGIYAMDPDEGEILYQIMQFATPREVLSLAANDGEFYVYNLNHKVTFANTSNIIIPSDPGFFVGREEFKEHLLDPDAHANRFDEIYEQLSKKVQIVLIPQGEDIPVSQRKENCLYFKVVDTVNVVSSTIKVSPYMGLKITD